MSVACQRSLGNSHRELVFLAQNVVTEILILKEKIQVHQNVQMEVHLESYILIPLRLLGLAAAEVPNHETQMKRMRKKEDHERMLLY